MAEAVVETKPKTAERPVKAPSMYHVIMLNDDITTMDFVVMILQSQFYCSPQRAQALMLQVHQQGSAICGTFNREIAEMKCHNVHDVARGSGYPLRCIIQQAD